jgi:hypothetical protein
MKTPAVAMLLALAQTAAADAATPSSCAAPEHRQFDFWVGKWKVSTPDGKLAGRNRITREFNGCVIHEHYSTDRGYGGESLNAYDSARKQWHQTWVDTDGLVLTLEGGWDGNSMVLAGESPDEKGALRRQRITWTPNADGSVRQLWEAMDANGAWAVAFDGRYTRE